MLNNNNKYSYTISNTFYSLWFWDQTFSENNWKFLLEKQTSTFIFFTQVRFPFLPFLTSYTCSGTNYLFSVDQSCHLWVMWSFLIPERPCWSDFRFQPWQHLFPSTWWAGWQHPIQLHLLATCPVNIVTDGSFLLEQLWRPESIRTLHRWLQPQRISTLEQIRLWTITALLRALTPISPGSTAVSKECGHFSTPFTPSVSAPSCRQGKLSVSFPQETWAVFSLFCLFLIPVNGPFQLVFMKA